jgi:uncharacterized membrane protein
MNPSTVSTSEAAAPQASVPQASVPESAEPRTRYTDRRQRHEGTARAVRAIKARFAAEPRTRYTDRRQRHEGTARAVRAIKARFAAELTPVERIGNRLTVIAGSSAFLVFHAVWFAGWIAWNVAAGPQAFDPFPFGLLTMVVSLEAIFLSVFVLMTQNRESAIAEVREEVTLAVNLRVEEEVTKVLQLVAGLYARLGQRVADDPELAAMLQPLDADAIEVDLTEQLKSLGKGGPRAEFVPLRTD